MLRSLLPSRPRQGGIAALLLAALFAAPVAAESAAVSPAMSHTLSAPPMDASATPAVFCTETFAAWSAAL